MMKLLNSVDLEFSNFLFGSEFGVPVSKLPQITKVDGSTLHFLMQVSMFDMNMRPGTKNPGRGYRFYTGNNIVYPFGHGLSYGMYECKVNGRFGNSVSATISLKSGTAGSIAVLVYYKPPNAGIYFEANFVRKKFNFCHQLLVRTMLI